MNTPSPDPGEEYPHINTDLYGILDTKNRFMPLAKMVAPYNAPSPGQPLTMDGFVADYISAFTAEMGRQPTYEEYSQIMTGYSPTQLPVMSTLAGNFAVFDHWFCEVPSQTFTNRSFFHAGTASGYVINYPPAAAFPVHNTAETIFERLEAKGLTWRVYCEVPSAASMTAIIHASRLRNRFATNFRTVADFLEDAKRGTLPTYSFIEPDMWVGHNDMHPPISALVQVCLSTNRHRSWAEKRCSRKCTMRFARPIRRPDRTISIRCCSSPSTKPVEPTITFRRRLRHLQRPARRPGKWALRSIARACACPPLRSRRGFRSVS